MALTMALVSDLSPGRRVAVTGVNPACFTVLLAPVGPVPTFLRTAMFLESTLTSHFRRAVRFLPGHWPMYLGRWGS